METFKTKHPVDYEDPYASMLADIDASIKLFTNKEGRPPNYVLINTSDYEHLVAAYHKAGTIPKDAPLAIIQSARLIRSNDMDQGCYDVVSN